LKGHLAVRRAVFLDRDGVLNVDSAAFVRSASELSVFPWASRAVARLNEAGYVVCVVTNQSGVGRGFFTEEDLAAVHAKLSAEIAREGGRLDAIYHCPHRPSDGCACRKPAIGMLVRAAEEFDLDLRSSWLVGDSPRDIACGRTACCRTILALSGLDGTYDPAHYPFMPDLVCRDVEEAARRIISVDDGTTATSPSASSARR